MSHAHQLPPELRRKADAAKRYPDQVDRPAARRFIPKVGQVLNMEGQVWKIMEVKSRGRWKAAFKGENPNFKPQVGLGLNFGEPGILQEIYNAGRKKFWAKPFKIKGKGGNN